MSLQHDVSLAAGYSVLTQKQLDRIVSILKNQQGYIFLAAVRGDEKGFLDTTFSVAGSGTMLNALISELLEEDSLIRAEIIAAVKALNV